MHDVLRRLDSEVKEISSAAREFASATAARLEAVSGGVQMPLLDAAAAIDVLYGRLCRLLCGSAELEVLTGQEAVAEVKSRMNRLAIHQQLGGDQVLEAWQRLVGEEHPKASLLAHLTATQKSGMHDSAGRKISVKKAAAEQTAAQAVIREVAADLAHHLYRALDATVVLVGQWRRLAAQQSLHVSALGSAGDGGSGRLRGPPVGLNRLRKAVAAYNQGLSFRALATLERDVARALGGGTFADLGRGESLLAALAENLELAAELAGGDGAAAGVVLAYGKMAGGVSVSLEELLVLAVLVLSARRRRRGSVDGGRGAEHGGCGRWDDEDEAAVETAIQRQYGVPSAMALGFGPIQRLLSDAATMYDNMAASEVAVVPALGLAPPPPAASGGAGGGEVGGEAGGVGSAALHASLLGGDWGYSNPNDAATAVLDTAPMLSDLAEWSLWDDIFRPHLGPLKAYLQGSGAAGGQRSWRAIEAPGGRLFKVQAGLGVEGALQLFEQRLSLLDAYGMAAALLSVVLEAGGVELAPMVFLESLVEGRWAAAVDVYTAPTGGSRRLLHDWKTPHLSLVRCCLDCLAAIPLKDIRTAVARRVLLPPLESVHILGRGWKEEMLRSCAKPEHRTVLHLLGFELGYQEWCRDWATSHLPAQTATRPPPQLSQPPQLQLEHQRCSGGGRPDRSTEHQEGDGASTSAATTLAEPAVGCHRDCDAAEVVVTGMGVEMNVVPDNRMLQSCGKVDGGDEAVQQELAAAASATPAGLAATSTGEGVSAAAGALGGYSASWSVGTLGLEVGAPVAAAAAKELETLRQERRLVVERIRHTYGIDKTFTDPDARSTIDTNTKRVGNAVEQLSAQLYSKDLHFVMELMQNAEDNSYDPDVVPCLEFVLTDSALVVLNNETGFKEQDICALSDVNMSTKKKKRGYIGKKGIGFKSVFKVSDAPEVHSNGFHVTFSRKSYGNLGMVLPSIVPPYDASDLPSQLGLVPARTIIRLPLILRDAGAAQGEEKDEETKMDAAAAVAERLRKPLKEVDPRLILFLKKLRRIAVTDATSASELAPSAVVTALGAPGYGPSEGLSLQVHKVDLGGGVVSLRYGPVGQLQETCWLIVSETFVPTVDRGDLSAAELGETEVSLAYDLGSAADMAEAVAAASGGAYERSQPLPRPPRQDVFAYLPTRDYGLRFMVNADFIVTTSREAVDSGNAWNQMLAARIPQLFARSLPELQRLDAAAAGANGLPIRMQMPPHSWLNYWLSCVPLPDEAQDLFSSMPQRIAEAVRASVLLPTACGQMLSPARHQLRVCQDTRVAELLAEPGVQSALRSAGLYFLSDTVLPLHANPRLRAMLHVQDFHAQDMVALLKVMLTTAHKGGKGGKALGDVPSASASESPPSSSPDGDRVPLGIGLLARLLLVIFSALGVGAGGDRSSRAAYPVSWQGRNPCSYPGITSGAAGLWSELRSLPLLPVLGSGEWLAAIAGGGGTCVFLLPGLEEQHHWDATSSGATGPGAVTSSGDDVGPLLASVGLKADLRDLLDPPRETGADRGGSRTAPQIQFLDPVLISELPTVEQRDLLLAGLRELGVRPLEVSDVYDLAVLPLLRWFSNAINLLSPSPSVVQQLPETTLVACLALPLAAGLLGPSVAREEGEEQHGRNLRVPRSGRRMEQQQHHGHSRRQRSGGSSMDELRSCAVLLTSAGAVRCARPTYDSGCPPPHELFLPAALCPGGFDLRQSFPAWCEQRRAAVISDAYLGCKVVSLKSWTWLFCQLGASPFLRPHARTVLLWPPQTVIPSATQPLSRCDAVVALRLEDSPWSDGRTGATETAIAASGKEADVDGPLLGPPPTLPPCPAGHVYRLQDSTCPSLDDLLDHILPPTPVPAHGAALDSVWNIPDLARFVDAPSCPLPRARPREAQQKRPPLNAKQRELLVSLAKALNSLWEDGMYGEALRLRGAMVVKEEAALAELAGAMVEVGAKAADGMALEAGSPGEDPSWPPDCKQWAATPLPSSFMLTLTTRRWLPTAQGFAASAPEVVAPLPRLIELFGSAPLPFLSVPDLPADCPLLAALGLPTRANPQLVVGLLSRLAGYGKECEGRDDETVGMEADASCALAGDGVLHLDPDILVNVYRYLAKADVGTSAEVCRAFAQKPLIWVPDGPSGASGGSRAVRGRFYGWQQVRLKDPTGVVEQLAEAELQQTSSGGPAAAADGVGGGGAVAAEALPLRILDAHYKKMDLALFDELRHVRRPAAGGQWVVFQDARLIMELPSLDDYIGVLRRIVLRDPTASTVAIKQARLILQQWSDGLASGALPEGGPIAKRLQLLLKKEAVFPTVAGGWASVTGGLLLNDDPETARLFGRMPGVHILDAAFMGSAASLAHGGASASGSSHARAVGPPRDPGRDSQPGGPLAPLLQLLGVPRLSRHVQKEIMYQFIRAGSQVERLVRISLQFVQRYLYHKRRDLYEAVRETVAARLPRLQVFVVDKSSLKVLPRLCHPDGRPPIPADQPLSLSAVLEMRVGAGGDTSSALTPWLYVDDVRNYNKICEELSRLFTPSVAADGELATFLTCLILIHEQDMDPDRDNKREAAEQYTNDNGCGPLPDDEAQWQVSMGMLQAESTTTGGPAAGGAAVYDLPEHDPDWMLAELAPPPQPRTPQTPTTPATPATAASTTDCASPAGGGFFNPFLVPEGSHASHPVARDGSDPGFTSASHSAGAPPPPGSTAPGPGPGPAAGGGNVDWDAEWPPLVPGSGQRAPATGPKPGPADGTAGPYRGVPRSTGVRGVGHLMGIVTAAYGAVAAAAQAAAAAAAASPSLAPHPTPPHPTREQAREYAIEGSAAGYGAYYDDSVANRDGQLQWMRLPDLLDPEGPGQRVLEALRRSAAEAAAVAAAGREGTAAEATVEGGVSDEAAAKWAEALVFELLRRDPAVEANGWAVEWVSEKEETRHQPYDILLTRGSARGPVERVYVEVKSSRTTNKRSFEVSTQELSKAQREGASYVIFRLLGVGSLESLELLVLADPWAMCARKELRLCVLT